MSIFKFLLKREEKKLQRDVRRGIQDIRRSRKEFENSEIETHHKNGEVKVRGTLKDGVLVGLWEKYYNNGQLEKTGHCQGGGIDDEGLWETYYENGQPKLKENLKSGKRHGLVEEFDKNGQLIHKGYYQDGIPEGGGEYYDKNGKKVINKLIKSYYHENSYYHVPFYDSYSKEFLCESGQIKEGKENGIWKVYWDMNKVRSHGETIDETELIKYKGMFKEGKKTGLWEGYSIKGYISEKITYKNGKKDGSHQYILEDGEIFHTKEYKDGELIE